MSETRNAKPLSVTPEIADKVRETLEVWAAWQQPAFSFDTIQKDPWTAVYLPIPDNADSLLMARAFSAASVCIDMIEQGHHGPRVPQGDAPEENIAKAEARMAELDARLAVLTANENSPERIAVVSRWTGEPLGETVGVGQSAGKGQSP